MGGMEYLLVLAGLFGFAVAIVSLIRPRGRVAFVRKRAGVLLGASLLLILAGGTIYRSVQEVGAPDVGVTTTPVRDGAELATVQFIIDGDTFTVALSDGRSDTVRLIGIDTPEAGECFADEATDLLRALVQPGSQVGLTVDISDTDRFDRLLRYVWVGEMSVNEELVRRGAAFARSYPPDTAMADRLESAESTARRAERGLWNPRACAESS